MLGTDDVTNGRGLRPQAAMTADMDAAAVQLVVVLDAPAKAAAAETASQEQLGDERQARALEAVGRAALNVAAAEQPGLLMKLALSC